MRRGQGLVATLLQRNSDGDEIEIWGDGENIRDYIFIEDTVEALIALAEGVLPGTAPQLPQVLGAGTSMKQRTRQSPRFVDARQGLRL